MKSFLWVLVVGGVFALAFNANVQTDWLRHRSTLWWYRLLYGTGLRTPPKPPTVVSPDPMDIIESPDGIRYSKSAYEAGRAEAREALSRGVLALQRREPNDPWRGDFVEILSRDYQIAYHISTGCIVSDRGIGRDRGFNEVMETAIESRFGIEVFKTAERKARQQFEERFPQ